MRLAGHMFLAAPWWAMALCAVAGGGIGRARGEMPTTRSATAPASAVAGANADNLDEPTRITLHFANAAPKDVIEDLNRQSGADIKPYPRNLWAARAWNGIDLDVNDVSLWTAVREFCLKAGLSLQRTGIEREMVLMQGTVRQSADDPVSEHGPFLFVADSIRKDASVDLVQPGNVRRTCVVQMMLYAEPRVRVLRAATLASIEEAVDERGNSLDGQGRDVADAMEATKAWMSVVIARLTPPTKAGHVLARLRGNVRLLVQSRSQTAEVALPVGGKDVILRDVVRSAGGLKLTIREVRNTGETYGVRVTVQREAPGPIVWTDSDIQYMIRMVDTAGQPLSRRGGAVTGPDMTLAFGREDWTGAGAGAPVKLVFEVPTAVREVRVPFEFENLPME